MADLIKRTEELILAVNAGARAIENTKRYHGTTYCLDVFSDKPKEIPYLKAAQILRGFDELSTVHALELTAAELKYLINDTIAYLWRLEDRGADKPEFGYDSRKALLEKLQQFEKEHFPEMRCSNG